MATYEIIVERSLKVKAKNVAEATVLAEKVLRGDITGYDPDNVVELPKALSFRIQEI